MSITRITYAGSAEWDPSDTALRARMAALARSAQTAGAEISAAPRKAFLGQFHARARELVDARLASGERIANVAAEVERVRAVLLRAHMTDLAHRPRSRPISTNSTKGLKNERRTAGRPTASHDPRTPESLPDQRSRSRRQSTPA